MLAWATGCGPDLSRSRYIPSEEAARTALQAVLTAWQHGRPAGKIADSSPVIQAVDSQRRPGQKLRSFAILGAVAGDSPRCFAVRLSLENPRQEQTARFVVVGIDPLWVFRYEDYEMLAHWE